MWLYKILIYGGVILKKAMIYVHGKGGSYLEAEQFKNICLDFDVFGVDYNDYFPWIVKNKIMEVYDKISEKYDYIYVLANSIGASVFIYTSLRESFGIPILEAMACGTPVITSTTSAMPEITGPEGILVNPFEPEEIASALLHLEENAEFYQSQTAYGLERVRRFSWENTAREILNIYKEILA